MPITGPARLLRPLLALVLLLTIVGCGTPEAAPLSPRLQAIKDANKLVIGTALTKPFEYHDPGSGQLVGMDVEIAKAIATKLGVPIEWREMAFTELIPTLQEGRVDMVIAAMYITPAREELVDLSQGYVDTGLIVVGRSDTAPVMTPEDLAGRSVGVKKGATGATYAQQLKDQGVDLTIQEYAETVDSLVDLEAGHVDVVLNDKLNSIEYLKTHPTLALTSDVLQPAQFGIAVKSGDSELLGLINGTLQELRAQGTLDKLYQDWVIGKQ